MVGKNPALIDQNDRYMQNKMSQILVGSSLHHDSS